MRETERTYDELRKHSAPAAAYILTNAHKRKVLVKMNARELYHFARLRMDRHAQWEIRRLAEKMIGLAREKAPLTMTLATGYDGFDDAAGALLD